MKVRMLEELVSRIDGKPAPWVPPLWVCEQAGRWETGWDPAALQGDGILLPSLAPGWLRADCIPEATSGTAVPQSL